MKRAGFSVAAAVLALLTACGSNTPKTAATDATTTSGSATVGATAAVTTAAPAVTVIVNVVVTNPSTVAADATAAADATVASKTVAPTPPMTAPKPKTTTTRATTSGTKAPVSSTVPSTNPTTPPALYKPVSPPTLPKDHTTEVPADGDLPNGVYWAQYSGGGKFTPTVALREAFFGDACVTEATKDGATCEDDIYIPDTPDREIDLTLATNVKLTVSDATTQKSYQITPDELVRIRASSPSAGAPDNFSFTPFALLATVSGAKVTKFEQVWTP